MTAKNVAKKEDQPLSIANSLAADAGMGMESADKDSFAIPFLGILQPLSPELDKNDAKYIEGAEAGQIVNTVTGKVFGELIVLPVAYKREIIEWVPRSRGGGMVDRFDPGNEPPYMVDGGKWITKDTQNDLQDTRMHYVLVLGVEKGEFEPAVMSLTSTQIKRSKRWMTQMQNFKVEQDGQRFTPPTFAVKYKLSTVQESNDKGKWYSWVIDTVGLLDEEEMALYSASKEFHSRIQAGEVKTAEMEQEHEEDNLAF